MTSGELKERLIDTVALLSIPGVGRGRFRRLVERFGSAAAALAATKSVLETVPGLSHATASAIKTEYDAESARQIAARIVQLGWTVLFAGDDGYPKQLSHIEDRPPLLFMIGQPLSDDQKLVAMVGTRHATEKGRVFAHWLAGQLSQRGISIVSGMAEGIDAAAHRGALDAGGHTIAVWGTSLEIIYPPANKSLAGVIREKGTILSEYLPETRPDKSTFPDRNRLISGMADAVIVVEAGARSGALITANFALEQGRELFAVPGLPGSDNAEGTNELIKKGAHLLTHADDIFAQLPRLKGEVAARKFKALPDMSDMEQKIVQLLAGGPLQIDQLARNSQLPVSELMGFMLALEMKGVIQELSGKRFVLSQ